MCALLLLLTTSYDYCGEQIENEINSKKRNTKKGGDHKIKEKKNELYRFNFIKVLLTREENYICLQKEKCFNGGSFKDPLKTSL